MVHIEQEKIYADESRFLALSVSLHIMVHQVLTQELFACIEDCAFNNFQAMSDRALPFLG